MKTRIVWTKIWEDEFFANLSRSSKLLFIYLISNQRINICGCYELPDRVIMFDTGLNSNELKISKKELSPKVKFYENWVYLPNAKKLSGYKGEKNESASKKEENLIPPDIKEYLYRVSKKTDRVSSFRDTTINHKSETINKKSETKELNLKEKFKLFLKDVNQEFSRQFTFEGWEKKAMSKFKDLLDRGYNSDDFKKVMGRIRMDDFHESKFYEHVTPEYIVRPNIFDKFLNR